MKEKLTLKWSKKNKDLICHFPNGCDGSLVFYTFTSDRFHPLPLPTGEWTDSFVKELKSRGYDITTLKFSINKL